MKNLLCIAIIFLFSLGNTFGQDSTFIKINEWLKKNGFALRQTFDGSENENKPANLSLYDNHRTTNDFVNLDLAVKLSQLELLRESNSILIFYPKFEWHKSNDSTSLKNKLDIGVNVEYFPFKLKDRGLPLNLPNDGLVISPWFQGTSSLKRNLLEGVYETKLTFQVSLASNYEYLPGSNITDGKNNFRARYYPYFGFEYNRLPNLVVDGTTEEFTTYFIRLFVELWAIPQTLQLNFDGTYREILDNESSLRTSLPLFTSSVFLYPGKQDALGLGYEYKYGYDNTSLFQLIQISSLKLAWKI